MRTRLIVRALITRDTLALVNVTKGGPRLLGGKVKRCEPLQDALQRELVEEIGCSATVSEVVSVTEKLKKSTRTITVVFKVSIAGDPVAREKGIKLAWVPRGQVCGYPRVIKFEAA